MSRPDDDEREIADASYLFQDDEDETKEKNRADQTGSKSPEPQPTSEDDQGYDLAGPEPEPQEASVPEFALEEEPEPEPESESESGSKTKSKPEPDIDLDDQSEPGQDFEPEASTFAPTEPEPPASTTTQTKPKPESAPERPGRPEAEPSLTPSPVDQPWSRMAEWGPALVRLGIVGLITFGLSYWLLFFQSQLLLAFAVFGLGLVVLILLSYPIAITLERPVRMTAEQAIRDYYGALAHHFPHYRRMWLLLSSSGRLDDRYTTESGFRDFWKRRQAEIRKAKGQSRFTPLSIHIENFKSEKNAKQDAAEASYTVSVFLRGQESDSPLLTKEIQTTLSRGPDRMWYLDEGRLL